MWYETLNVVVAVLGPLIIYLTVVSAIQLPDQIVALPMAARYAIEVVGALFIVGAWVLNYAEGVSISGGLAFIGLLLVVMPLVARQLSQADHTPTETPVISSDQIADPM